MRRTHSSNAIRIYPRRRETFWTRRRSRAFSPSFASMAVPATPRRSAPMRCGAPWRQSPCSPVRMGIGSKGQLLRQRSASSLASHEAGDDLRRCDGRRRRCHGAPCLHGVRVCCRESYTIMQNRSLMRARTWHFQNGDIPMVRHLKIGVSTDTRHSIRVYFEYPSPTSTRSSSVGAASTGPCRACTNLNDGQAQKTQQSLSPRPVNRIPPILLGIEASTDRLNKLTAVARRCPPQAPLRGGGGGRLSDADQERCSSVTDSRRTSRITTPFAPSKRIVSR